MADDDRKTVLIAKLADHVLDHGIAGSSLRELAKAAGTSDRMLLYYFADKDELLLTVLAVIAERLQRMLAAGLPEEPQPVDDVMADLLAMSGDPLLWRYQRLFLEIASRAAHGDALCKAVGQQLGRGFLEWGAQQIAEPDPAERASAAARLLLIVEGSVFLRALGLEEVVHKALG